jgi:hypothetical protein
MSRLEATLARYAKSAGSASVNANDKAKVAKGTKLQKLVRYSIYPIYGLPAQIAFDTTTAFFSWESQANSAFVDTLRPLMCGDSWFIDTPINIAYPYGTT